MKTKARLISDIVKGYNALCNVVADPVNMIPNSNRGSSRNQHLALVKKDKNNFHRIVGRDSNRRMSTAQLVYFLSFAPKKTLERLDDIVSI